MGLSKCKNCIDIKANTTTINKGSTSSTACVCTKCPINTYKITYGNELTLCLACPSGFYCPQADSNPISCKDKYGANCATCDNNRCLSCKTDYGQSPQSAVSFNACYCKLVSQIQKDSCLKKSSFYVKTDDIEGQIGCSGLCVKKINAADAGGNDNSWWC